jgi:protein TonB
MFLALAGSLAVLFAGLAPSSAEMPLTSAPKPLARANPEYPRHALRRGVEGSVLLEFSVDRYGNVVSPRVIESRPRGVFDAAALERCRSGSTRRSAPRPRRSRCG